MNENFLTIETFLFAFVSCAGVALFCTTMIRLSLQSSSSLSRQYSPMQYAGMFIFSVMLVSAAHFLNMDSHTVFADNAYNATTADPWLFKSNISSILSQLDSNLDDVKHLAEIIVVFLIVIKAIGVGLCCFALYVCWRVSAGASDMSAFRIILYFIASACFFNIGPVISAIAWVFGYEIQI